ncbi:MAG TPA: hypothetical protein VFY71_13830 [Planctomycetota bacterium]|nr:hypothetical protein [Planctomycetota bacterium]
MKPLPLACLVALAACATPKGTQMTAEQYRMMEMQQAAERNAAGANGAAPAAPAAPGMATSPQPAAGQAALTARTDLTPDQAKKRDDLDKRRTELQRRREDQARGAFELEQKRKRVELDQANAVAQADVALAAADREWRLAAEDLKRFREDERPRRLAEDALDVQVSADGLLEAAEELKQLEMMYSDSQLGDATAEIVLNRSRRRLSRAEERHKLRQERSDELKNVTLPREEDTRAQAEHAKAVALDNVKRSQEKDRLEREAALRDQDFEARKLEREEDDIKRDEAAYDRDMAAWTRELALVGTVPTPAAGTTP